MSSAKDANTVAEWIAGRGGLWLFVALIALTGAALVLRLSQLSHAKNIAVDKTNIPTVTVTIPGESSLPTTVSIIGTIAARYDVPIGVDGDGGRVEAIYVEAGDHVKRGQLLARLSAAVLRPQVGSLAAGLEQSRTEAELAEAEYKRAVAVGAAGALSTEETERRRSTAATAAAKVKVAEAQLAEAQARLDRLEVRAPADGTVLTRTVELGQTVTAGGPALFRLAEGNEVELRGEVAEQDLPVLQVGQAATVTLTGNTQSYAGKVRLLGAVIDPQTRLGMVRVTLAPDANLRPGAFARADITISRAQRSVLPQTAVLTDDKGSYVLVVDAHNTVQRRDVRVSGIVADGVTIASGLSRADRVVASAGAFLQPGEIVNPSEIVNPRHPTSGT
jgi:RND family efflux transporter MFP subunit